MATADSAMRMAARVAQRRMTLALLPVRLWLGFTWLRSGVSKLVDPAWFDGAALTGFLQSQLEAANQPIPQYAVVMETAWTQVAAPLGIAVMVAEIAVGVCLLTGTLTSVALVVALALNLNYLLAGSVIPTHLYVVAEVALLLGGAGAHYSVDRYLGLTAPGRWLGARGNLVDAPPPRGLLVPAAVVFAAAAAAAVPQVVDLLPSRGADDPAFITVTVFALLSGACMVLALRRRPALDTAALDVAPPAGSVGDLDGGRRRAVAPARPARPAMPAPAGGWGRVTSPVASMASPAAPAAFAPSRPAPEPGGPPTEIIFRGDRSRTGTTYDVYAELRALDDRR